MNEPTTLIEAIRYFADPDVCLDFMVSLRWPDGVVTCPTCERDDVRFIPTPAAFGNAVASIPGVNSPLRSAPSLKIAP